MADYLTVDYNQPSSSPWQLGQGFPKLPNQFNQFKPAPGKEIYGIPPEDAGAKARYGISPGNAGEKAATYQSPTAMDCKGFTVPVLGSEICWSDVFAYGVGGLLVIFGLLMVAGGTIFGVALRRK